MKINTTIGQLVVVVSHTFIYVDVELKVSKFSSYREYKEKRVSQ